MISEQYLMRNLMRTCAVARRPHKSSSCEEDTTGRENKDTDVEISLFGTKWTASFLHNEVKTFIIEKNEISECNFIEWK